MRKGAENAIAAQASVAGPGAAVRRQHPAPGHRGRRRAERDEEDHRAGVAAGRIDRRHHHRHADRVDRVDLLVDAAAQEVRRQVRAVEVLPVVAAGVVVLDLQIAVAPQALRDHQVVRLVARRKEHGVGETRGAQRRPPPRSPATGRRWSRPAAVRSTQRRSARQVRHGDPQALAGDDRPHDPLRRTGQHLHHRPSIGQTRQERHQQQEQPEQRQDEIADVHRRPPAAPRSGGGAAEAAARPAARPP